MGEKSVALPIDRREIPRGAHIFGSEDLPWDFTKMENCQ
jgi:hypothetical protein